MTRTEIAAMLDSIGLPVAYYQFPETGQAPPFICYFFEGDNDFIADDTNYQKIDRLAVELYTDNKDFALEASVEAALSGAGLVWSRSETYIDSERMYEVIFNADIVITEETNG